MIRATPLREIVGADAFGTVAGTHLRLAVGGNFRIIAFTLGGQDAGGKHLHGAGLVFVLRTFVLTGHNGIGGQVRDAHSRFRFVDVLAASAGGPVNVDAQVFRADFHVHFFRFGHNGHGGGRGVDAALGFRGGHTLHAVGARLELEAAVHLVAADKADNFLEAARFRGRFAHEFHLPALNFGIA